MEKEEQTAIVDLWTRLTGRERVLTFHLGNIAMIHLPWNELDDRQKGIVLNAGDTCGLGRTRLPDPSSSRRPGSVS